MCTKISFYDIVEVRFKFMGKFGGIFSKITGNVEVEKKEVRFSKLDKEVKKLICENEQFAKMVQKGKFSTDEILISYTLSRFESQKLFTAKIESDSFCTCCRELYLTIKVNLPLDFKFSSNESSADQGR